VRKGVEKASISVLSIALIVHSVIEHSSCHVVSPKVKVSVKGSSTPWAKLRRDGAPRGQNLPPGLTPALSPFFSDSQDFRAMFLLDALPLLPVYDPLTEIVTFEAYTFS
jgi:hypothetical protein